MDDVSEVSAQGSGRDRSAPRSFSRSLPRDVAGEHVPPGSSRDLRERSASRKSCHLRDPASSAAALERDRQLLREWQAGDSERGLELVRHYHPLFRRLCREAGLGTQEQMLDLYQEMLLRLLRVLPNLALQESFGGYLRKVIRTSLRELRRPDWVTPSSLDDELATQEPSPSRVATDHEHGEAIRACRDELEARERRLFDGRLVESLSFSLLAQELGVSLDHLYVLYYRVRKKLRACLLRKGIVVG